MAKTLMEEFDVVETKVDKVNGDLKVFNDKELLDKLRSDIIENIIDKKLPNEDTIDSFLNDRIDESLEGYDLSNLERSHIYNMIKDEINGMYPFYLDDNNCFYCIIE